MTQLFRAGIIAICRQVAAVLVLTSLLLLTAPRDGSFSSSNARLSLLTWSYVLVAVGLALTTSRSISVTAARLNRASYVMRRGASKPILMTIVAQFGLAAVLCMVLALWRPALAVLVIAEFFGDDSVASVIWPALMSAEVAGFGATAYAGIKAIELSDRQY